MAKTTAYDTHRDNVSKCMISDYGEMRMIQVWLASYEGCYVHMVNEAYNTWW